MQTEDIMMIFLSILCVLAILFTGGSKRFILTNIVVFAIYSIPLWWAMLYNGDFGSGFLWLFYLAVLTAAQLLFVLVYQSIRKFKGWFNK